MDVCGCRAFWHHHNWIQPSVGCVYTKQQHTPLGVTIYTPQGKQNTGSTRRWVSHPLQASLRLVTRTQTNIHMCGNEPKLKTTLQGDKTCKFMSHHVGNYPRKDILYTHTYIHTHCTYIHTTHIQYMYMHIYVYVTYIKSMYLMQTLQCQILGM